MAYTQIRKPLAKATLEQLSADIVEDPATRKKFMDNPEAFVKSKYGKAISADEMEFVKNLQQMVADGFCCKGCGCSPGLKDNVINPGLRTR